MEYLNVAEVMKATNRIPYSAKEVSTVKNFLLKEQKNGLDVRLHRGMSADGSPEGALKTLQNGILIISCPQIDSDIIFAKVDDGRGLFGGQKVRFQNFLGTMADNEFLVGATHKYLLLGLTGINNIFRSQGLLKGGAY